MGRALAKRCELTERDQSILREIFECKICRLSDLKRWFFPEVSMQAAHKRLTKLIEFGYLGSYYLQVNQGALVYRLGNKGVKHFFSNPDQIERKQFKSYAPEHDLVLGEVKHRLLETEEISQVRLENYLQCLPEQMLEKDFLVFRKLNSDGLVEIKRGEKTFYFALEVELHLKAHKRYQKFFTNYYLEDAIDGVLVVTSDEAMGRKMQKLEENWSPTNGRKMFYCHQHAILNGPEIIFESSNSQLIKFRLRG